VCLDVIRAASNPACRSAVTLFAFIALVACYPADLTALKCRQTSVDVTANRLASDANVEDLIIVHPWYYGVSFQRYYRGRAPWTTLPPLEDHSIHRYDLLKSKMQQADPIGSVRDKIIATLEGGHSVWIVGEVPLDGRLAPRIQPAPNNPWGWLDLPYSYAWGAQAGAVLAENAKRFERITNQIPECVNQFEDPPVTLISRGKGSRQGAK
jgi:hypothetical protein